MTPTVRLYADDTPPSIRRSQYKAAVALGRKTARQANTAYLSGDYPEAARLARECVRIARQIGDAKTEALWLDRAGTAERYAEGSK